MKVWGLGFLKKIDKGILRREVIRTDEKQSVESETIVDFHS